MVNRLQAVRSEANMSIMELHKRSGVSRVTITKIEKDPSFSCVTTTLEKISSALGKPVRDIFF